MKKKKIRKRKRRSAPRRHTRHRGQALVKRTPSPLTKATPSLGQIALSPSMGSAVLGLSGSNFTSAQRAALEAPFTDDEIEIKPTGEVYVSHVHYRTRLNRIFGGGNWGLMSEGEPKQKGDSVIQHWFLFINRLPVAEAYRSEERRCRERVYGLV